MATVLSRPTSAASCQRLRGQRRRRRGGHDHAVPGGFATQPAMLVLVTSSAPAGTTGRASSLYLLACLAGGSLGTLLLGVVWRHAGWFGIVLACYAALLVSFGLGLYQTSRASRGAQALPLHQRDH